MNKMVDMRDPADMRQDPGLFGREWTDDYDVVQPVDGPEVSAAVSQLARLADGGPILELAAGTGRIAIPLAKMGIKVTATDASDVILQKLRDKDTPGLVSTRI